MRWMTFYEKFLAEGNSKQIEDYYSSKKQPPFLGSELFIEEMKCKESYVNISYEIVDRKYLKPSIEDIMAIVALSENLDLKSTRGNTRREEQIVRSMVIYIAKNYFGYKLREIGSILNIQSYSGVSNNFIRFKCKLDNDEKLRSKCINLFEQIANQAQTE